MHLLFTKSIIDYQNCSVINFSLTASSKTTMNLIDEPLLAAVRSIENADQDNNSQGVNITLIESTCWAKINLYHYFEIGH